MINGRIVDTSVWIDFLSKKESSHVTLFKEMIFENCVMLLPVIMQEVLQGIREDILFNSIKSVMQDYELLEGNQLELTLGAAGLYRFLRGKGITIQKPNDCLIAYTCLHHDVPLLHNDKDFTNIAKHTSLKIYK